MPYFIHVKKTKDSPWEGWSYYGQEATWPSDYKRQQDASWVRKNNPGKFTGFYRSRISKKFIPMSSKSYQEYIKAIEDNRAQEGSSQC